MQISLRFYLGLTLYRPQLPPLVDRIRVIQVRKTKVLLLYGKVRELQWDPGIIQWANDKLLMDNTTRLARELLRKRTPIPIIPHLHWLPLRFSFRWKANWGADRASKESGLIWQLWHRAIAVNDWRAKISPQIDTECLVCCTGESESI